MGKEGRGANTPCTKRSHCHFLHSNWRKQVLGCLRKEVSPTRHITEGPSSKPAPPQSAIASDLGIDQTTTSDALQRCHEASWCTSYVGRERFHQLPHNSAVDRSEDQPPQQSQPARSSSVLHRHFAEQSRSNGNLRRWPSHHLDFHRRGPSKGASSFHEIFASPREKVGRQQCHSKGRKTLEEQQQQTAKKQKFEPANNAQANDGKESEVPATIFDSQPSQGEKTQSATKDDEKQQQPTSCLVSGQRTSHNPRSKVGQRKMQEEMGLLSPILCYSRWLCQRQRRQ